MKKMGFQGPQTPYIEECTQTSPGAGKWHRAGVSLVFTVVTGSWTEEGPLAAPCEPPATKAVPPPATPCSGCWLRRRAACLVGFARKYVAALAGPTFGQAATGCTEVAPILPRSWM